MPGHSNPGFDTLALHAGAAPDPATGARAVPIHLTTSFVFESSEHAASLFNMERSGHVYSRISNPTNAVLEERVAALEGGAGAIATASGQAALHLAIATHRRRRLAHRRLERALRRLAQPAALHARALRHRDHLRARPATSTPGARRSGPRRGCSSARRSATPASTCSTSRPSPRSRTSTHLPLLVDSTFTTPWLMRPFEHGADLLYHSATKFLSGHGTVIGGVLVDSGSFDWDAATAATGRFTELTRAYEGFHGMVFSEESTVGAFLLRARREGLRDFGASMSPHTAWLILQGIETLPLRMARHVENTRKVVAFLAGHETVARVGYPELESHPDHALARRLLPRGCGSVFSFDLQGSREQGRAFIEALQALLAPRQRRRLPLARHPSGIDHALPHGRRRARARRHRPGTIRLSIGLEDADDLIDDLKRALKAAERAAARDARSRSPADAGAARRDAYVYTGGKAFDAAAADASSSSTARCTTTASGPCSRAGSRTTATPCSRSTCRATGAAPARR